MSTQESHDWVRSRLARWRTGLLEDPETERVAAHLRNCEACRTVGEAFAPAASVEPGAHVAPSLMAEWPRARQQLRGVERALVRGHLERCAECRQDLELLGYEPWLEPAAELESAGAMEVGREPRGAEPTAEPGRSTPADEARPTMVIRLVPAARDRGARSWNQALLAWASLATAAAALAIVGYVRRPVLEGVPAPLLVTLEAPGAGSPVDKLGEPSLRIAPRPRSLSGPAHGPRGGKLTVIPVIGPVTSLALTVHPLDVPDTSWVSISLVAGDRDTLFTVRHRQWEFFPKRVLVIDGERSPLMPGRYALVLESWMGGQKAPAWPMARYLFELRPRRP